MIDNKKIALIIGISGQDGSYLAHFLLKKDYNVYGSSRDHKNHKFENLKILKIFNEINLLTIDPKDFHSIFKEIVKIKPNEIYFLAGQSSVGLSFDLPHETIESITLGTLNILEAARMLDYPVRVYHAGSSECFGETDSKGASELTNFNPKSPYAVAKATASWLIKSYRDSYKLFCCTGFCFNHESPLRPQRFVTKKIISYVNKISAGEDIKLSLGNISISRDWGWAPEYVEAMWLMLQNSNPEDYVIGTGKSYTLQNFLEIAFEFKGLNWKDYVFIDKNKFRPNEINFNVANPMKLNQQLGWSAKVDFKTLVERLF